MRKNSRTVLSFDLDFTLINNKRGIVNAFNYALRKFNLEEVDKKLIEKMIGIPLEEMFINCTELNPSQLCSAFREYYGAKGLYQSRLLSGVKRKLKELMSQQYILGIITSKKQSMARKIAAYLKIEGFFDYILGETEEIKSKLDMKLTHILLENYPNSKFIIIGDHPKDAMLSKNLGCPFIGVLTGIHTAEQLIQARGNSEITLILKNIKQITVEKIEFLIDKIDFE